MEVWNPSLKNLNFNSVVDLSNILCCLDNRMWAITQTIYFRNIRPCFIPWWVVETHLRNEKGGEMAFFHNKALLLVRYVDQVGTVIDSC